MQKSRRENAKVAKENKQLQKPKQIPFGNDNKKSKGNDNRNFNGNDRSRSLRYATG